MNAKISDFLVLQLTDLQGLIEAFMVDSLPLNNSPKND